MSAIYTTKWFEGRGGGRSFFVGTEKKKKKKRETLVLLSQLVSTTKSNQPSPSQSFSSSGNNKLVQRRNNSNNPGPSKQPSFFSMYRFQGSRAIATRVVVNSNRIDCSSLLLHARERKKQMRIESAITKLYKHDSVVCRLILDNVLLVRLIPSGLNGSLLFLLLLIRPSFPRQIEKFKRFFLEFLLFFTPTYPISKVEKLEWREVER